MPALLDTGRSPRGWSWYAPYFRCMHLGALLHLASLDERSDALIRGTMVHIGLGHLHLCWWYEQVRQPNPYYTPEDAIRAWCEQHPEGSPFLDETIECVRRYAARYPQAPGRIVGIEFGGAAVLGTVQGVWQLWVLNDACTAEVEQALRDQRAPQGTLLNRANEEIAWTPLNMPGHPEHGHPIPITRKLDMAFEDGRKRVHVYDWKSTRGEMGKSRAKKYAMDGQFAVSRIFAEQHFGAAMDGCWLALIQTEDPWKVSKHPVPLTPHRDALFPTMLFHKAHEIARWQRDEPDPHRWPMAQHESVCTSAYEKRGCVAMDVCSMGASWTSQ